MTDVLQTIALACFFLPAVILLWLRVSVLTRQVEELHQQYLVEILADDIRQNRPDTRTRGGWHDYNAVN